MNKQLLYRWAPVLVWAAVIFYFSSRPIIQASEKSLTDFLIKKTAHVAEYAILFALLARAFNFRQKLLFTAYLIGLLYAFTDETHQLFVPGRTGKITDVLIFDQLGLLLSWRFIKKNLHVV